MTLPCAHVFIKQYYNSHASTEKDKRSTKIIQRSGRKSVTTNNKKKIYDERHQMLLECSKIASEQSLKNSPIVRKNNEENIWCTI